jgi:hypothetical protein
MDIMISSSDNVFVGVITGQESWLGLDFIVFVENKGGDAEDENKQENDFCSEVSVAFEFKDHFQFFHFEVQVLLMNLPFLSNSLLLSDLMNEVLSQSSLIHFEVDELLTALIMLFDLGLNNLLGAMNAGLHAVREMVYQCIN